MYVPPEMGKDQICQAPKQINFTVRRDTYFKEMKRSNKSRKTARRLCNQCCAKLKATVADPSF